jgi:hypothetical protein
MRREEIEAWTEKMAQKSREREAEQEPPPEPPKPAMVVIERKIKVLKPVDVDQEIMALPVIRNWLFAPDNTQLRYREFETPIEHKGQVITQKVKIGYRWLRRTDGYGILTARHQRALFALQALWQDQGGNLVEISGKPHGIVAGSSWELEKRIFGDHGGRQKEILRHILAGLAGIPITIENYIFPDGKVGKLEISGLLQGYEFHSEKTEDPMPWVGIILSSLVTHAFDTSAIKPLNLRILAKLGGSPAALLYPKVDHLLSNHPRTELRLDHLAERMGMMGTKQMSQAGYRARKFAPYVEALDGLPLSKKGFVIEAQLEPTADKKDHKISATRRRG